MMKFLFCMIMLMPLSFLTKFWLNQWFMFILSFLFFFNYFSNMYFTEISFNLGCDLFSFILILLSFWICSLMIMSSMKLNKIKSYNKFFIFIIFSLMVALYLTFSSLNLFIFYLFFEVSLIPTLILIIGWGYQPERLEAGIYLLFYTMFMSLPMLIMLFYLYKMMWSLSLIFMLTNIDIFYVYLGVNLIFFVKIPMYFLHLWLPKAHVEAPVSGSMILAGIMLKLGGYGLIRLMGLFKFFLNFNLFFIVISLMGGVFVSLICLRQSDIKALIAYSSVSHMGLVLSGIMTFSYWGVFGALMMMIAHGLCSSGLFCMANLMYERSLTRSLYLNKGMIHLMPSFSLWWFLLLSSNMAAPPSLNLIGEIMLINSLVSVSWINMMFLSLVSFFSATYSLFLFSYSQHGEYYSGIFTFFSGSCREYLLLMLHWLPLNLMFLKLELFI